MVLGNHPVPGRRAGAYCACSRCGWGLFGHFFLSSIISLCFFCLILGDGPLYTVYTEILSQRAFKPNTTNQPNQIEFIQILSELTESESKAYPKHQRERWTTYLNKQKNTDDKWS